MASAGTKIVVDPVFFERQTYGTLGTVAIWQRQLKGFTFYPNGIRYRIIANGTYKLKIETVVAAIVACNAAAPALRRGIDQMQVLRSRGSADQAPQICQDRDNQKSFSHTYLYDTNTVPNYI